MLVSKCVHALAVITVLVAAAGCGSSPTTPSSPPSLQAGSYYLEMTGVTTSLNPQLPPCAAPVTAPAKVTVPLDVSAEGAVKWVGRTPSFLGDLELSIQSNGAVIEGFVKGTAMDASAISFLTHPIPGIGPVLPASLPRIRIGTVTGSAAVAKGAAEQTGQKILGTISGDIEYFTNVGDLTKCPMVIWTLRPG